MKKSIVTLIIMCLTISMVGTVVVGCPTPQAEVPDKIVVGQVLQLSGAMAQNVAAQETPQSEIYLDDVNAKGGIYVPDYGKRLPIERILYDSKSDIATCLGLYEKLITVDKVDLLAAPNGTNFGIAVAPLATEYKYPLITYTVGSDTLIEASAEYPYLFALPPTPSGFADALAEVLVHCGVKNASIFYLDQAYGMECAAGLQNALPEAGINIEMYERYAFPATDLSGLLKKAQSIDADALLAVTYPTDTFLAIEQIMTLGYNPKLFGGMMVGATYPMMYDTFGDAVNGIIGMQGFNEKLSPEAKAYIEHYIEKFGVRPDSNTGFMGYAVWEVLEVAIEKAGGFADREKLRDVIATETIDTIYGPLKFEGGQNTSFVSIWGQWQNGVYESIWPQKAGFSVEPLYPKPAWPQK